MRNLLFPCVLLGALPLLAANPVDVPDVAAFDRILKTYVLDNGTVKYAALKTGIDPLKRFVEQIGDVSPDSHPGLFPSREDKIAYWINTYNALVLWSMAREYPEKKDRLTGLIGRYQFFIRAKFKVGGRDRTLDDIEKNAIRKQFQEPRVHFALVCASRGCPWLSREAFTGARLNEQLDARASLFLSQDRNFRVDRKWREVTLSQIFDWYKADFGSSDQALLSFISKYRTAEATELQKGKWDLKYADYDWGINEAK